MQSTTSGAGIGASRRPTTAPIGILGSSDRIQLDLRSYAAMSAQARPRMLMWAFTPRPWPSTSTCRRPGRPGPLAAPKPWPEPAPRTTQDSGRQRSPRWPGNYEKLASRGCPSDQMKTALNKPYSPLSQGYSRVPTRFFELFQRWIEPESRSQQESLNVPWQPAAASVIVWHVTYTWRSSHV